MPARKYDAVTLMRQATERFRSGTLRSQIGVVVFQSGFEAVVMTIASFLVAKLYGPALLGQLGILLAAVQLATMMGDGLSASVVRFVSKDIAEGASTAASKGWLLSWVTIACSAPIALAIGLALWAGIIQNSSNWWILLAVILSVLRNSRGVFDAVCRAMRNFAIPAKAGIICSFGIAAAIIYFSYRGYRVGSYLAIMTLGMVFNTVWLALEYRHKLWPGVTPLLNKKRLIQEFLRFSLPLVSRGFIGFLFLKINIWLVGGLAGDAEAGQFRLADQVLTIPLLLVSSVLSAVSPRVAKAQAEGKQQLTAFISKIYGLMVLISVPFGMFCFVNHLILVPMFPDFRPASVMVAMFGPVMLVMGLAFASSILIVQGGYPHIAFWLTLLPSIGNVLAALIGFYLAGSLGLMAGTAITHFLTYVLTIVVAHRLFKIPFQIKFL